MIFASAPLVFAVLMTGSDVSPPPPDGNGSAAASATRPSAAKQHITELIRRQLGAPVQVRTAAQASASSAPATDTIDDVFSRSAPALLLVDPARGLVATAKAPAPAPVEEPAFDFGGPASTPSPVVLMQPFITNDSKLHQMLDELHARIGHPPRAQMPVEKWMTTIVGPNIRYLDRHKHWALIRIGPLIMINFNW